MIKRIEIKKLFGHFDYDLNLENEKHVTILTGPNGYGKTTILRMICTLFSDSIESIYKYEFNSFKVVSDSKTIIIKKRKNGFEINGTVIELPNFSFIFGNNGEDDMPINVHRGIRRPKVTNSGKNVDSIKEDLSKDNCVGKLYTFINNKCIDIMVDDYIEELKRIRDEITSVKNEIGTITKISEQRLVDIKYKENEEPFFMQEPIKTFSVVENSSDLKEKLDMIMQHYSEISAKLDSTYAERLFQDNKMQGKSASQIEHDLERIKNEQEKLRNYGFSTGDFIVEDKWKDQYEKNAKVLSIYINDMVMKYEVFGDILKKLELYENILNKKLAFKKVKLSYKDGIQVLDEKNSPLKLTDLSSGEQNILVLYYRLIFESDVNLILVDEPEISLHIAWQKQFVDDLKEIIKLRENKLQAIVATHSAELVLNDTDVQIDLGGLYNEQFNN